MLFPLLVELIDTKYSVFAYWLKQTVRFYFALSYSWFTFLFICSVVVLIFLKVPVIFKVKGIGYGWNIGRFVIKKTFNMLAFLGFVHI